MNGTNIAHHGTDFCQDNVGGGVTVVDSMPTASAELAGKLYQYMGVTNPNFEQKAIYICNGSGFKCYKLVNEDTPYYFKVMPIPGGQPKPLFSDEDCTVNVGGVQYLPISGGTYVCNLSDSSSFTTTERETVYSTFAWDRVSAESDPKYYTFATEAEWEVAQEEFEGDEISFILETQEIKWGKMPPAPSIKALKFTATGASTIAFDTENEISFEKSTDGENWEDWDFSEIALADGESVYIRGNNPNGLDPNYDGAKFVMTGSIACEGNIMHLLDYEQDLDTVPATAFYQLFDSCASLTSAPELPATTLGVECYYDLFLGTSLTSAPELPATTLAESCYEGMFWGCTALVNAPELPATTLAEYCYKAMFKGCTSLVTAPELPVTVLAKYCYYGMFEGCTSLINAPELPASTLAEQCYCAMFKGCTSLVTTPELPATILTDFCYSSMFSGCTALENASELPATTLAVRCYDYMFNGCTSLTSAPELPATTLVNYCYNNMFSGCSKINDVEILATNISAGYAIENWLKNTAASGVIKCDASMVATFEADANTPAGWTVEAIS